MEFLERFDVPFHKIASPMIRNLEFCQSVAELGRKTFISTGMCSFEDIVKCIEIFDMSKCPVVLMHCVSIYPAKTEQEKS